MKNIGNIGNLFEKYIDKKGQIEKEMVKVNDNIKKNEEEIKRMNEKISKNELKIKEICENIESIKQKIENNTKIYDSSKTQIDKFEEKNRELNIEEQQKNLMNFQSSYKNYKNENTISSKKLENILKEIKNVDNLIENLIDSIGKIRNEINHKKKDNSQLKDQLIDFESNRKEIFKLKETCDDINKQITIIHQAETKYSNQIRDIKINLSNQIISNNGSKVQTGILEQTRLKSVGKTLQHQRDEAEKEILKIQNEINKETQEFEKEKELLISKKLSLATTINDYQQVISKEDTEIRNVSNELNKIKVKLESIRKQQSVYQNAEKEIQNNSQKTEDTKKIDKKKYLRNSSHSFLPNATINNSRTLQLD